MSDLVTHTHIHFLHNEMEPDWHLQSSGAFTGVSRESVGSVYFSQLRGASTTATKYDCRVVVLWKPEGISSAARGTLQ
jgi:hypothetical protein